MALASSLARSLLALAAFLTCAAATLGASAQAPSGMPSASITAPGPAAAGASDEPAAAAAEAAAPQAGAIAEDPSSEASVEAPAPTTSSAGGRAELERKLHELEQERAHWTNFWPWVVVGTGIGMTALGTVVGVGAAFDCEPDTTCAAPPWATLFVVVGVAIGTAGSLWLLRTDAGIRQLELQTQRVRMDLDQLNHARLLRERGFAQLGSTPLNLRLSF